MYNDTVCSYENNRGPVEAWFCNGKFTLVDVKIQVR